MPVKNLRRERRGLNRQWHSQGTGWPFPRRSLKRFGWTEPLNQSPCIGCLTD